MEKVQIMALLAATAVTAALTPLTMLFARRLGLMDRPDARKVHVTPTPRLAGMAMVAGMLVAGLGAALYLARRGEIFPPGLGLELLAIAGAGSFVFLVGIVDDIRTVSSRYKLLALITASLTVCGAGATFGGLVFGGEMMVEFKWLAWLATMLWIISVAVSVNFIDGLDGLAGGIALLASAVLATFLILSGNVAASILPLVMCGSLIAFLCFNWHPARTFMGDSGSLTIGFLLGSATVMANSLPDMGTMKGVVIPALALSVPLTDAALTMFRRRYQQRRSIFSAEQGHIHHRLIDRGLTHRQAVLTLYVVSIMAVGIGLISLSFEGFAGTLAGLSLIVPLIWGTFRLAGSMRTSEMVSALRQKREIDRTSRIYRQCFEQLQLEFTKVNDFATWWQAVCRTAGQLHFYSLTLPVVSRDGSQRIFKWSSVEATNDDCVKIKATVPIADRRAGFDPLEAAVEVPATLSLESAGERLALFSRLMHEYSLAGIDRKQPRAGQRKTDDVSQHNLPAASRTHLLPLEQRGPFGQLRVAIVHDFLYTYAGAERVVEQLIDLVPHCDVFALFDFVPESERHFLRGKAVTTTLMQKLPLARKKHRAYLPIMPFCIEQLDVSQYDLVISSSYLAAKGVITGPDQLHVCYCHSPARYAWDLQHQYLNEAGLGYGPKGIAARFVLHYLRQWDARSALGVDHFIANSDFVARRIKKIYRRDADVVNPPVDTEFYTPTADERGDYYIAVSRMVPYKRTDLIVGAFSKLPNLKLKVVGAGPDFEKVKRAASPNVELLGFQDAASLRKHLQRAKALIFAAEEDFGIVPVEALACGVPVIAFGKGGVTETIVAGQSGAFFNEQTVESLVEAIKDFESGASGVDYSDDQIQANLRSHAQSYSPDRFRDKMTAFIGQWVAEKWPERFSDAPQPNAATVSKPRQHPHSDSVPTARGPEPYAPPATTDDELLMGESNNH